MVSKPKLGGNSIYTPAMVYPRPRHTHPREDDLLRVLTPKGPQKGLETHKEVRTHMWEEDCYVYMYEWSPALNNNDEIVVNIT